MKDANILSIYNKIKIDLIILIKYPYHLLASFS